MEQVQENIEKTIIEQANELGDIVQELTKKNFFSELENNVRKIEESIENKEDISRLRIKNVKEAYSTLKILMKDYDETLKVGAEVYGYGLREFKDLNKDIVNCIGSSGEHVKEQIGEYINSKLDTSFEGDEGIKKLFLEEETAKEWKDLATNLFLKEEKKRLENFLNTLYEKRDKLTIKLKEIKTENHIRLDFLDKFLRLSINNGSYTLEVRNDEGKSLVRKTGDSSITDNKRTRKEIIEEICQLDMSADEDNAETEYLHAMVKAREFIDKSLNVSEEKEKITYQERIKAMELLKNPGYLFHVKNTLDKVIAGEDYLKLANYVIGCGSRFANKFNIPQGMFIQSVSGSGKTFTSSNTIKLFPEENVEHITGTTATILKYWTGDLWGKIMFVEEWTKQGEGIAESLRMLLSGSGDAKTYSTQNKGGKWETAGKKNVGVPTFISGTVLDEIEEQLANRCWITYTDATPEQTKRIMDFNMKAGMNKDRRKKSFYKSAEELKNCYRCLQGDEEVTNIFTGLVNSFFDYEDVTERRHQPKIENLVKNVTRLHQYQRKNFELEGSRNLLTTLGDYFIALRVMEPYLKLSFTRASNNAQLTYQVIKSENKNEGVDYSEICKHKLLRKFKGAPILKYYLKELIDEEFIEHKNGKYFPINTNYGIDGIEIDRKTLESNILSELGRDFLPHLEKIGVLADENGFKWEGYKEKLTDPITGEEKTIILENSGEYLKVRVNEKI